MAEGQAAPEKEKPTLRRQLFRAIREIDTAVRAEGAREIGALLRARPEYQSARTIGAFIALPSEPDLGPLLESAPDARQWCLPRVSDGLIEMRSYAGPDSLRTGEFGITEPDPDQCPLQPIGEIDLLLIPGVGFDPGTGTRLGRGKGHYDRFLAHVRALKLPPPVWGIGFSCQQVSIQAEPHDQPVDAIVTEQGIVENLVSPSS